MRIAIVMDSAIKAKQMAPYLRPFWAAHKLFVALCWAFEPQMLRMPRGLRWRDFPDLRAFVGRRIRFMAAAS